jgi:hypothetical protein
MADERDAGLEGSGSELPVYGRERVGAPRPPQRRIGWVAAGAVLVVVVCAVGLTKGSTKRQPGREDTDASTSTTMTTSTRIDRSITPGAPTDGKASKRLKVRLTPDKDLVDGQIVGIHGSGFVPGKDVGVVVCVNAAQTQGVAACDLSTYAISTPDAAGEVQGLFKIRRFITIQGQQVDCMNGAIDPEQWALKVEANGGRTPDYPHFTCAGVFGQIDDYDNSGGWPFALQGATFKPLDPTGDGGTPAAPASSTTSLVPSPTTTGKAPDAPTSGRTCPFPDPTFPATTIAPPAGTVPGTTPGTAPTVTAPATTTSTAPTRLACDPGRL